MSLVPTEVLDSKGRATSTNVDPTTGKRMSLRRPSGGYPTSAATVGGSPALANAFTSGSKFVGRPKAPPVTRGRDIRTRGHITRSPMFRNAKRTIVS